MTEITINGVTFDPSKETPALKNLALFQSDASSSDFILVQTSGPLTSVQKAELKANGATLLRYEPVDTYTCYFPETNLDKLKALPFVTWVHTYLEAFKIAPELHAGAQGVTANLLDLQGAAGTPDGGKKQVNIVFHQCVNVDAAVAKVAAAAGISLAGITPQNGRVRLAVDADRLNAIARIDEVSHIEAVHEKKLWNNVARGILGVDTVNTMVGFNGTGQIVAVCDTGFDTGNLDNPHPAFEGRVKRLYSLGRPGDPSDPDGHGTHVCGSVLGDGHSQDYGQIRGAAHGATLVMQSILDADGNLGGLSVGFTSILQQAYDDGARVHSNSWGDTNNHYTADSHDADDFVWHNRDLVVVIAAGNAGKDSNKDGVVDSHSVGSPGTAKNCITVGASENVRPDFYYVDGNIKFQRYGEGWPKSFPVKPVSNDPLADNSEGLAAFSSRGPTADGRIKPDVVAPGTAILSTRSQQDGVSGGWGPSTDSLYFFEGGTSMAAPLVSGCAAVVREFLHKQGLEKPSAALVKALIINAAVPLRGQYTPSETGTVPNSQQGFGRVNLANAVGVASDNKLLKFWDEDKALDTGDEQIFDLNLPSPVHGVTVTLVWTDPAGESLQNDLDLTVQTSSGTVAYGNAASGSTIPDRTNNVEQATLQPVPAGKVTIKVKAYRCAIETQTFALVVRVYP